MESNNKRFNLEYMESIIKAKSVWDCFLVDANPPTRRVGPRLLLRALLTYKYGAMVCFRLYQRSHWKTLSQESRTGIRGTLGKRQARFQRIHTILLERVLHTVFHSRIGNFAEICPGVDSVFFNNIITAGSKVSSGAVLSAAVSLVGHRNEAPTILEGAILQTGCVVIGGVTVGCQAVVGANSVVISDVPDGATVVGNPAKIVFRRRPVA